MLRLSVITNCDFLCFGARIHISKKHVYMEIEAGRWVFLVWLKDRTFIESAYPKLMRSLDTKENYVS